MAEGIPRRRGMNTDTDMSLGSGIAVSRSPRAASGSPRPTSRGRGRQNSNHTQPASAITAQDPQATGPRTTEPAGWNPYLEGPFGIIPRRGGARTSIMSSGQLRDLSLSHPMRLLQELMNIHPSVDFALETALTLACPAGGYAIECYDPDGTGNVNQEAQTWATEFWTTLPPEIGGEQGFAEQMLTSGLLSGMMCAESVPGEVLTGLSTCWPVDALTIGLARKDRSAPLTAWQCQIWPNQDPKKGVYTQWVDLPADTFHWLAVHPTVTSPMGRAPYATALNEVIADLALMQDLRDAVHNSAWPRYAVGVDMQMLHKTAVEVYRIQDVKKAAAWVNDRFQEVVKMMKEPHADDNIVHQSSGTVNTLQPGSFEGLQSVLAFLRHRIVQALKTLPTLMGINDGTAVNNTSVEWGVYATGLEAHSCNISEIKRQITQLHIRLKGSKAIVKVTPISIRKNDAQIDANVDSVKVTTAKARLALGFTDEDEESLKLVGHKAKRPPAPGVITPLPDANAAEGKAGSTNLEPKGEQNKPGAKKIPQNSNQEGTTKDERSARPK